jgi:hypothetical protein
MVHTGIIANEDFIREILPNYNGFNIASYMAEESTILYLDMKFKDLYLKKYHLLS